MFFKKAKRVYLFIIILYAFIGLFNSLIANSKPLISKTNHGWSFPAFNDLLVDLGLKSKYIYTQQDPLLYAVFPPIKHHFDDLDMENGTKLSPSLGWNSNHLLGTDKLGRDTFAGIIRGCYTSFRIGFFVVVIAGFFGTLLGLGMAYYKDDRLKLDFWKWIICGLLLFIYIFYLTYSSSLGMSLVYSTIGIIGLVLIFSIPTQRKETLSLPLDSFFSGVIAIRKAIPSLLWILACLPIFKVNSINNVIIIMSILGWVNFARHARAEALNIMQQEYFWTAQLAGAPFIHLVKNHFLPIIFPTLSVIIGLSFSASMLTESSLSFLGIGLPADEVSWGNQLYAARQDMNLWWLAIFPGFALFGVVFSFNKLVEE
jgi:peptide/nickel transport system permease protein